MRHKNRWLACGLALCVTAGSLLECSGPVWAKGTGENFDMSQSAPTAEEEWERLRLDMKWAEEQDDWGYWGTPLGNGLFMAKENGGVDEDVFVLNHSTFWSGDPAYRDALYEGEEGYGHTIEERAAGYEELIDTLTKAYTEGVTVAERKSLMESINSTTKKMWESQEQGAFLSSGRMKLKFPELTDATDYKRMLDLDKAISEISFKKDNVGYLRETFISNPDNVMVTRITNEENRDMEMELSLSLPKEMEGKSKDNQVYVDEENQEVVMTGRAPYDFKATRWADDRGTLLEARAKIVLPGKGKITISGNSLKVSGADEILVLYTCETSFKDAVTDPSNSGVDYNGKVRKTLDNAQKQSYEELLNTHLEDYRELFRRLWIDLDGENILAADGKTNLSPREYALHYQFARYTSIAIERENSFMPYGLFGMWQPTWTGVNEGAYFLNENMEKSQAMKGAANLADASDSQYRFISDWAREETGQRTAQTIYGAEEGAWLMSHSTGIWAKSGMWGGEVEWGSWLTGGIWALDSLYDKYEYTQDISLLEKYYPLIEGAAKFALSTLIEVDGVEGELKGYKVVAPAGSPEHWYWVNDTKVGFDLASACDTLLYYNLFNIMEKGAKDLDRAGISYDEELLDRVLEAREQMIPLEMFINEETGHMKEWYNEYEVGDKWHRHASHLLGLFLSNIEITPYETPELWEAQKKEMKRWMEADGGPHPDRSLMAVRAGYEDFGLSHMELICSDYNHDQRMYWAPLTNAIPEAILDSRFDSINLMENLPSAWSSGSVKGICARGGYQLSIVWENGELVECVIDSSTGETPRVFYKGEPVVLSEDNRFTVNRNTTTMENLTYEAEEKLEGKYTQESKEKLQAALDSRSYDAVSEALLGMEPVHYLERDVTVTTENGVNVLSGRGNTLQLTAASDKKDAKYTWSIAAQDGSSAEKIATIDENGLVTAVGGGLVTVTVGIEGEAYSQGTLDLMIEAETYEVKESVDDRDSRFHYSPNWLTWEDGQHRNSTITYSQEAGATAELTFKGSGFDFIGSSAQHIGNFKVILDGEVLDEHVYSGNEGYNRVMYSKVGLEDKEHTVVIEGLDNRIDMDAMDIYGSIASTTDRKDLIAVYKTAQEITEGNYAEENWNAFTQAREAALLMINDFDASQEDITAALEVLQTAMDNLEQTEPQPETDADVTALNLAIAMVEKLEIAQQNNPVYTEETWAAMQTALNDARELVINPNAGQAEVDNAFLELMTAINLLESDVQKMGLGTAIEGAKAILEKIDEGTAGESYTTESVEVLRTTLVDAEAVYADKEATQTEINTAATSLMTAVNNLLVVEGQSRLEILIQKAQELLNNADQYTDDSVQALSDALEAAKEVAEKGDASEEEINNAYNNLAAAMAGLERAANKAELENALNKAEEILTAEAEGTKQYTGLEGLQEAKDAAQHVYDNDSATVEEIEEALKVLIEQILEVRLLGDVNNDEKVDSADAQTLLRYNAEMEELSQEQLEAADVNKDEAADTSDAGMILQYAAEIIETF